MGLEERRRNRLAASTAEAACAARAAGTLERGPSVRNPDHLAARFIKPGLKLTAFAKVPGLRRLSRWAMDRVVPGTWEFEIGRTRYMDELLLAEVAAGVRQVVILGAGFDTRAYRLADELHGAVVFEVDHPLTARLKRERVQSVVGEPPKHVTYVEVDFTRDDLAERLAAAGYDHDQWAFFIWSGVTVYIPEEAVHAVLAFIGSSGSPDTSVVFDYAFREMVEGDDSWHGAAKLRRRVEKMGEPLIFGIPEGQTADLVAEHGLRLEADMGAEDCKKRYLARADGSLVGEPYGFGGLAHARLNGPGGP